MFPNLHFDEQQALVLFLVLLRMSAFVVSWPIFGVHQVPNPVKILLAVTLSVLVYPAVDRGSLSVNQTEVALVWLGLKEVTVGLFLGYLMRLFFFAVSVGSQIISTSMGLANGQLLNPAIGIDGSAVEQFQISLATLFFLGLSGHHLFLLGLMESFEALPISLAGLDFTAFSGIGKIVQEIMVFGVKMAAPVMTAILVTNLAMGILGRAVPQINVFITSLPVNILLGFMVIAITIPMFTDEMGMLLNSMTEHMFSVMREL